MSLERLINLAHQTGDRLIVHNELEDKDVVLMNVDEYEALVISKKASNRQSLEEINSDIESWQADQETDVAEQRDLAIEDDLEKAGFFDNLFGMDYAVDDWHSAGDVLDDKYGEEDWLNEDIQIEDVLGIEDIQTVPYKDSGEVDWQEEPLLGEEPIFYEEPIN